MASCNLVDLAVSAACLECLDAEQADALTTQLTCEVEEHGIHVYPTSFLVGEGAGEEIVGEGAGERIE